MRASLALFALGLAVGLYFGTVSMSLIAFGFYVLVTGVFFLVRAVSQRPPSLKAMLPAHGYLAQTQHSCHEGPTRNAVMKLGLGVAVQTAHYSAIEGREVVLSSQCCRGPGAA